MADGNDYVRWFDTLGMDDVPLVGGKNASLGEMIRNLKAEGVRVPNGFATTVKSYWDYLEAGGLNEKIKELLDDFEEGKRPLAEVGKKIRRLFISVEFPQHIAGAILEAYQELGRKYDREEVDVAVRSSATAEDLPGASFAGQQETYLNVTGDQELLEACRKCYASLFTDRAISYRVEQGFDHMKVALSIGVQKMIRSDLAGSGVMFTLDTDTGFRDVVLITAAWGLGENVVQGAVNPDEYMVFKPLIGKAKMPVVEKKLGEKEKKMVYTTGGAQTTKNVKTSRHEQTSFVLEDDDILRLAEWAALIEDHYGKPMDIEWAKDGELNELNIVQARPETVQSQVAAGVIKDYELKEEGKVLITGLAIGEAISTGKAQIIKDASHIGEFKAGSILVTGMTDPDWVPIMKKSAGIITDHGGRTSHAAIVSREFGIPAVVGTETSTKDLAEGMEITLSCAEGNVGYVYEGVLDYKTTEVDLERVEKPRTAIMINLANPDAAYHWWKLPVNGVGLARMEFIIMNFIKVHPMALVKFDEIRDSHVRREIDELTRGYDDKTRYFVDKLSRGIAKIASSQYPDPVIVRMSDFKTNEYADLIGGRQFEPHEENPMIGFRGASRYYSDEYREGFALECKSIKKVRNEIGLSNVVMMIPFCRTLEEADKVLEVMAQNGLERGEDGLQVYVMCEIPSNVVLADEFSRRFDGFSIGSNDLTQLTLGVDRDSDQLSHLFDERNPAVKWMISHLIPIAHENDRHVGICGQAPSDYPEFAEFLVKNGIDTISLNPDSVIGIIESLVELEKKTG